MILIASTVVVSRRLRLCLRARHISSIRKVSNRLTRTQIGAHTEAYAYKDAQNNDAHGCMTAMGSMNLSWDFEDQLQRVNLGGDAVKLERETLHVVDDKRRIALVETRTQGNDGSPAQSQRYQISNHLGSASLELNENGALISYEEYHPYGASAFQTLSSAAEVSLKRYRYTGKERDEETGLYYHGARYYAPWLGRWTACDPAGLVDGVNVYAYVKNNSVRLTDQFGLQGDDPDDPDKERKERERKERERKWKEKEQKAQEKKEQERKEQERKEQERKEQERKEQERKEREKKERDEKERKRLEEIDKPLERPSPALEVIGILALALAVFFLRRGGGRISPSPAPGPGGIPQPGWGY